jgi:hypothetical protein
VVDCLLSRPKAATFDSFIDRGTDQLGNPDVHLPITALTPGFSETLYGIGSLYSWHGAHLSHS